MEDMAWQRTQGSYGSPGVANMETSCSPALRREKIRPAAPSIF